VRSRRGQTYAGRSSEGPRHVDPPTTCVAGEHIRSILLSIVPPTTGMSNTRNSITHLIACQIRKTGSEQGRRAGIRSLRRSSALGIEGG
jgi:hypothetical protein